MGMETPTPPIMSTLNPNASEFVPAAARPAAASAATVESRIATPVPVTVAAAPRVVAPEYSSDWWNLIATDQAFREHYLSNCHFESAEQRDALVDSLDELADEYQFHGYQEHLVHLEEEEILRRNLADMDYYLDEELRLTDANTVEVPKEFELPKELDLQQQLQLGQQQQQRAPLSSNHYQYQNNKSLPSHNKVGSYPKKWNNTYRLHQPRTDM